MAIYSIRDIPIEGKRVFIRVDFNVPFDKATGEVSDTTRIDAALPTIRYAQEQGARVILASHLGRPKGKPDPKYSMQPVGKVLAEKLPGVEILVADEPVGDGVTRLAADLKPNQILLLENLRYDSGEEGNDPAFSKELAALADVYINDAFGTAHRAHGSTAGMVEHFDDKGAGFLMMKEVEFFTKLLKNPDKPFVAILGGAKVADKVGVIRNLLERVNAILIGGAMANTFLAARGRELGASRVEEDKFGLCREIEEAARARNVELLLPSDLVVASSLDAVEVETVAAGAVVPADRMALDIGPETRRAFAEVIGTAATIFWNGPMGVFENPVLAEGTLSVARAVATGSAVSVVGGGDSVAAINKAQVGDRISHVSTGGGASLEMMEGRILPGVAALEK